MLSVEKAINHLRTAGYKITNARRAVLTVLCESEGHLTSTDIIERVDLLDPNVGRASVFRTLELLTELSVIRPTYLEARTPSYVVLPTDGHHAHIVCTRCNIVIEVPECQVDEMLGEIAHQYQMALTGHLLELYGVCTECAENQLT